MATIAQKADNARMRAMDNAYIQYYDINYDSSADNATKVHQAMREIIAWLFVARQDNDFEKINDVLCEVDLNRLDTYLIITTLRSTSSMKDHIECWCDKVDEADIIITRRGQQSKQLLKGLKKF